MLRPIPGSQGSQILTTEGQSPPKGGHRPVLRSPVRRERHFTEKSPGTAERGAEAPETLPGPDLEPDGAREEGVGDTAELEQSLPLGAPAPGSQPCSAPRTEHRRAEQPGSRPVCQIPHRPHLSRQGLSMCEPHLPEAGTLQAGEPGGLPEGRGASKGEMAACQREARQEKEGDVGHHRQMDSFPEEAGSRTFCLRITPLGSLEEGP